MIHLKYGTGGELYGYPDCQRNEHVGPGAN